MESYFWWSLLLVRDNILHKRDQQRTQFYLATAFYPCYGLSVRLNSPKFLFFSKITGSSNGRYFIWFFQLSANVVSDIVEGVA